MFVYALPFELVVWSRSILGLGLPSSANGNCLFVSNQGAFNVSRVSSRSALIELLDLDGCQKDGDRRCGLLQNYFRQLSYFLIRRCGRSWRTLSEEARPTYGRKEGSKLLLGNKKHLKNVGPIRHSEPPRAHSADVASGTVVRRLRIGVHDDIDNDNA